jgi:hypothetical protein
MELLSLYICLSLLTLQENSLSHLKLAIRRERKISSIEMRRSVIAPLMPIVSLFTCVCCYCKVHSYIQELRWIFRIKFIVFFFAERLRGRCLGLA